MQASTDKLDLLGICKMLLSCKGNCSPAQSGIYWNLRMLIRQESLSYIHQEKAHKLTG